MISPTSKKYLKLFSKQIKMFCMPLLKIIETKLVVWLAKMTWLRIHDNQFGYSIQNWSVINNWGFTKNPSSLELFYFKSKTIV